MIQYAIYDHPSDYPDSFVVRKWIIEDGKILPGELVGKADTLSEARNLVPDGLFRINRFEQDDSVLTEVWL